MSIAASGTSEAGALRYLGLAALALALPVFLVAGLPVAGWLLGAGVWLAQRALQLLFASRLRRTDDPRAVVGYEAGGAIARGWLAALAILVVGILAGEEVGLSAVVLVLVLFSIYFAGRVVERASQQGRHDDRIRAKPDDRSQSRRAGSRGPRAKGSV